MLIDSVTELSDLYKDDSLGVQDDSFSHYTYILMLSPRLLSLR